MNSLTGAERLAGRSRSVTIVALVAMTLLAWGWLLSGAGMSPAMAMTWNASRFLLVTAMWWVMMVAMMLPSAAPAILLFGRVHRHRQQPPPTGEFLAGYLALWLAFAVLATVFQQQLEQRGLVSQMAMTAMGRWLPGMFLIAAGLYQWSPLKNACLSNCRSPTDFLTRHYRPGRGGAWRLGLIHGAYCVGCCWLLMILLFVGGVMNLAWIAGLTLLVAAEKLLPGGHWIARISGATLILWGAATLFA